MRLTLEQIKAAKELNFDYYRCMDCNQEQVNIAAGDFPCCWCNNGCNTHGDIHLSPGRGLPKKVKEELIKQTEESEKQTKQQELIDDALVIYKLTNPCSGSSK
jgi:hypothetical protein